MFTDPMNPAEVGVFDTWYAHDVYVQNDTGYFSNVWEGFFSIVDLTDKSAPVFVNSFGTIDGISHNAWASTDGNFLFTTDETADGGDHLPRGVDFESRLRHSKIRVPDQRKLRDY